VGAGTSNCCQKLGFQETQESKNHCCYLGVCIAANTLAASDWLIALIGPRVGLHMIPQCTLFSIYCLWLGSENILTQNLDVKTWCAAHFPVNHWRCSYAGCRPSISAPGLHLIVKTGYCQPCSSKHKGFDQDLQTKSRF
jgi:hypothetical protein